MANKKRIFSGIQPTGQMQLGNYLGAVKNWVAMQDDYDCCFCVVDQHSMTVRPNPSELHDNCLSFLKWFIACGLDPEKSLLYFQSHVPQHAQLSWVLSCFTQMGELSRMTQFKDKSKKHPENINAGLFTYPVLMAADILVYQADLVPVGHDQKQHMELAQIIAKRFNGIYGDVFTVPETYISKVGARIMSLSDPTSKMSKSDPNPKGYISLDDTPEQITKKIKSAVTDSEGEVAYREGKDGINNLLSIYAAATGTDVESAAKEFSGAGYGTFKTAVAEAVVEMLRPIQQKAAYLDKNADYVEGVYKHGAEVARVRAQETIDKVYECIGFIKG